MQYSAWRITLMGLILTAANLCAADEPALEPVQIGQPTRIEVFPPAVKLPGPRSRMQLVVTGHYADGSVQDLTRASQFASTSADVADVAGGVIRPRHDGQAQLAVVAAGRAAIVPVEVSSISQ